MKWLIEAFFGKWETVMYKVVPTKNYWLVVVARHSITGRVRGYVDMGKRPFYELSEENAKAHLEEYEKTRT